MRGWHAPRNLFDVEEVRVEDPFQDDPRLVRTEELRRLERCERGLAEAYRRASVGRDAEARRREAKRHRAHADLLRRRVEALGRRGSDEVDEDWLQRGPSGPDQLRLAEYASIATYHDHLTDFDVETAALVRERILPEHEQIGRAHV